MLDKLDREAAVRALVIADAQSLDYGASLEAEHLGAGDDVGWKIVHRQ
jgi:hypothetical protein